MIDWQSFHFIRPLWLLALLPLAALIYFYFHQKNTTSSWQKICDAHLLQHLLIHQQKASSLTGLWFLGTGWLLCTLALAGPTWSKLEQPLYQSQEALVIVTDLSRSMDANDLRPSRIDLAKFKLIDLLKKQQDGKTALIVYASEPYIVSPLTNDTQTIISQVPTLVTALMPQQGSNTHRALEKAGELMRQAGIPKGHVLLITDGIEDITAIKKTLDDLKSRHIKTSVLAVGTQEGAPIPLANGGFLKNNQGAIVIPQLDAPKLQQIAQAGGGLYQEITANNHDINTLSTYFTDKAAFENKEEQTQFTDTWKEQGPWLVLLLLPFAALAFRKGWLTAFFVCLLLPTHESHAFEWQDLWLTPDQQAARAYEQQDLETASQRFENPHWQGVTHYQNGDYEKAAEILTRLDDPEAHYNRGNALAKAGKLEEAIQAYDQTLEQQPQHEDAAFNRDLVQKLLDQQQSQENQSQQGNQNSQQQSTQQNNNQQNEQPQDSAQQAENQNTQDANEQQNQQESMSQQNDKQETLPEEQQHAHQQSTEQPQGKQQEQSEIIDDLTTAQREDQQAVEQWLRRIPDDPGGLLRRKFIREHQKLRAKPSSQTNEQPW